MREGRKKARTRNGLPPEDRRGSESVADERRTRALNPRTFVLLLVLPRHLVNTDMQARFQTVPQKQGDRWETEAEALIFIHAPTKRQFFAVLSGL